MWRLDSKFDQSNLPKTNLIRIYNKEAKRQQKNNMKKNKVRVQNDTEECTQE
jgi:hypothetical protein